MLKANISVKGLDQVLEKLAKIDPALKDLEPQMQEAGNYMMQFLLEVVASQGGNIGETYASLSEPYASQKAAKYGNTPILVASGEMINDYHLYTASDYLLIKNEKQTQSDEWLAGFHQEGTTKMPKRMMAKLQSEQLAHVTGIIIGRIHQILN